MSRTLFFGGIVQMREPPIDTGDLRSDCESLRRRIARLESSLSRAAAERDSAQELLRCANARLSDSESANLRLQERIHSLGGKESADSVASFREAISAAIQEKRVGPGFLQGSGVKNQPHQCGEMCPVAAGTDNKGGPRL